MCASAANQVGRTGNGFRELRRTEWQRLSPGENTTELLGGKKRSLQRGQDAEQTQEGEGELAATCLQPEVTHSPAFEAALALADGDFRRYANS